MGESIKKCGTGSDFVPHPELYSGLVLAYLGDAVYELMIRERIVARGNKQVNKLHREATRYVNAAAQAELIENVMDELTDEEKNIYRRGRNATSNTVPKNQSVGDYRKATGFEALVGYLYMTGNINRIEELFFKDE